MKKTVFILLALLLTMCMPMMADNDRVITFDQLPQTAQTMLKTHFADKVPLVITVDWDDYKVMYQSGEKVEFDKKGNWKDLDCKVSAVPTALIPEQIKTHVKATFPGTTIIKLDRDRRGYDVKLNNGLELEYNKQFQVVDIDD
ncbi:MAG: PepSY-like domain-containing protein [Prevotella sp.]|nr:PepSY-like domain-containing protein [Prevotella sp.]MBR3479894.1 PepSY-like domain-containing protein [Prevotella sp.]